MAFTLQESSSNVLSLPGVQAPSLGLRERNKSTLSPRLKSAALICPEWLMFETPLASGEATILTPECFLWPRDRLSRHSRRYIFFTAVRLPGECASSLNKLTKVVHLFTEGGCVQRETLISTQEGRRCILSTIFLFFVCFYSCKM